MKPFVYFDDVDFSWILGEGGIQVSRNDIDTENTKRSKVTGTMYRKRLTSKRKLVFGNCLRMTTPQIASLHAALDKDTLFVRYLDFSGEEKSIEVYGSSFDSTTQIYDPAADETYWNNTTFNLIEV